ncbi:MAG TPA: methyl-accepting chemotaxis protein [Fimbriimonadaceae bacterium]|nr:methyl-accepting chemotaxis protein [Fimbriimonadaceae bacterium]
MNFVKDLKVGAKLAVGFIVCGAFLLVVALTGGLGISKMHGVASAMVGDAVDGLEACDAFNTAAIRMREWQLHYAFDPQAKFATIAGKIGEQRDLSDKYLSDYEKTIVTAEDRTNTEAYTKLWTRYKDLSAQIESLAKSGDAEGLQKAMNGEVLTVCAKLVDQGQVITKYNNRAAAGYVKEMDGTFRVSEVILVGVVILAILASLLFGVSITRQIIGPIRILQAQLKTMSERGMAHLAEGIGALARGDLTVEFVPSMTPLEVNSKDELGQLTQIYNGLLETAKLAATNYNESRLKLTDLVLQIKRASNEVSSAANSLTSTSQQVEAAAQEVSASMQEISSASGQAAQGASEVASGSASQAQALSLSTMNVQKLVDAVREVADDAQSAAEAAGEAGSAATEGTTVIAESMKGMQAIRDTVSQSASVIHTLGESSQKIGMIVQTINEIAEQTNLLALNAAIEAARAGEAGRGFAVVADEVRKLAERSGAATREIGGLIAEIQTQTSRAVSAMEAGTKEVESQTKVAEGTQFAFQKIQDVVQAVNQRVEGIREATQEMANASQEVARSITEVAAVVEQSSAAAEELSASAEEVSASVETVAGAAGQQSAAVAGLVASSDELQNLAQQLTEIVDSFRLDSAKSDEQPYLCLSKAA